MKEATLDQLMQALGWTLIHSLWQTFLVALCLYVLLAFSHKFSPSIRYVLGVIALLFTGFLVSATFLDLYFHHQPALKELQNEIYVREISGQAMEFSNIQAAQTSVQNTSIQFTDIVNSITTYLNLHLHWVVALWLVGVLLLSLRFTGSLLYIHRIKNRFTKPLAEEWQNKMQAMADLLQLHQSVKLLTSKVAKVPMMIGHLKPVILIPASMMSGLPEDQLEAIIAHEIAHIYRKDYWINILQSLFEIIFFFHPAIWWISSVIREEREKCCDDLAIILCGDSITYAKALASVEEVKLQHMQMALAVNGGKSSLFQRIERLLEPGKRAGNQRSKFVSVSLVLVSIVLLGSAGDSIAYRYGGKVAEALAWVQFPDSIIKQDTTVNLDIENDIDIELDQEIEIPEEVEVDEDINLDLDVDVSGISHDTLPKTTKPQLPVHPFAAHKHANLHISHDSLRQVKIATSISNQIHAFPNIDPVLMNLNTLDSIPDIMLDISAILDSIPKFDFAIASDSGFVFSLRDGEEPHHFHFDSPDVDVSTFTFDFDSAIDLRILNDSLPQAMARLDEFLQRLQTSTNGYQFHVQDTSIEKRLRELEASLRKKEREFEKLMQEKEQIIQELLHDNELEVIEEQMQEQERIFEEQMEQQEEHMRIQEEMMEKQLEDLERSLEADEERLHTQESRFDEVNNDLEEMLLSDKLIEKGERYSFKISSKGLFLNDDKLNDQYFKKYLKWMQENEVFQFEEGSTLSITRIAK